MPKLSNNAVNDELQQESILMGENEDTEYDVTVNDDGRGITFGRELKYSYPEWAKTPELRQKYRRQERRRIKRERDGKEPFVRGPKKSDVELRQARKARREVRNDVKWLAIKHLADEKGVTVEEMYAILKDSVING